MVATWAHASALFAKNEVFLSDQKRTALALTGEIQHAMPCTWIHVDCGLETPSKLRSFYEHDGPQYQHQNITNFVIGTSERYPPNLRNPNPCKPHL